MKRHRDTSEEEEKDLLYIAGTDLKSAEYARAILIELYEYGEDLDSAKARTVLRERFDYSEDDLP